MLRTSRSKDCFYKQYRSFLEIFAFFKLRCASLITFPRFVNIPLFSLSVVCYQIDAVYITNICSALSTFNSRRAVALSEDALELYCILFESRCIFLLHENFTFFKIRWTTRQTNFVEFGGAVDIRSLLVVIQCFLTFSEHPHCKV